VLQDGSTMPRNASIPPTAEDFGRSTNKVEEENLDKIVYTMANVPQKQAIDTPRVKAIHHDPENVPPSLLAARQAMERGRYDEARELLPRMAREDPPVWARQEAAFRTASSWWYEGELEKAVAALADFKKSFPNSWYVPEASQHRARALVELDRPQEAVAEFKSLRETKGLAHEVQLEADYWLVWIAERLATRAKDNRALDQVVRDYEALVPRIGGRANLAWLVRRVQVGRASALLAQGKTPEAQQALTQLASSTPATDKLALAGTHTLLGNAVLKASPKADEATFHQALRHFLRVVTLYGDAPGAEDYLAESLYQSGEMFWQLHSMMKEETERTGYRQRAHREWRDVRQRFPQSGWAQQANQALTRR
jgi:tetratricopeptide (TPR) repeat protein